MTSKSWWFERGNDLFFRIVSQANNMTYGCLCNWGEMTLNAGFPARTSFSRLSFGSRQQWGNVTQWHSGWIATRNTTVGWSANHENWPGWRSLVYLLNSWLPKLTTKLLTPSKTQTPTRNRDLTIINPWQKPAKNSRAWDGTTRSGNMIWSFGS